MSTCTCGAGASPQSSRAACCLRVGEVIDARDATVIPGLIDVHAHLSSLVGERLGRAWLAYGVTTVRELTTTPAEAVERAEAWASGRSPGPRLVISATRPGSDAAGAAVRAYPGIAQGFAHSLRRQVGEIAVPAWAPTSFPARLPTERRRSEPRARAFPGLYGLPGRVQPIDRVRHHVCHGSCGARGAARVAKPAAPYATALSGHCSLRPSRRHGNGPMHWRPPYRRWSEPLRACSGPEDGSP